MAEIINGTSIITGAIDWIICFVKVEQRLKVRYLKCPWTEFTVRPWLSADAGRADRSYTSSRDPLETFCSTPGRHLNTHNVQQNRTRRSKSSAYNFATRNKIYRSNTVCSLFSHLSRDGILKTILQFIVSQCQF